MKKILVPIFFRANYGRLRPVLKAIANHPELEFQIITGVQAARGYFFANLRHSEPRDWLKAIPWYLKARVLSAESDFVTRKMEADGFSVGAKVPFFLDGGLPATMAKSVGLGIISLTDTLRKLKPDLVLVDGDRFEMMAITIAASFLNIPIAHNEAGDVSGNIDESIRHAITKFAQVHFTNTDESRRRVLQLGEDPRFVFKVGSSSIDVLKEIDLSPEVEKESPGYIDLEKPYLLVIVHPVTTESREDNLNLVETIIKVAEDFKMPTMVIGSNFDARSRGVGRALAEWYETKKPAEVYFVKQLHPDRFYRALANAACTLGNSSSFLREGAYLGTPAVLVGSRQQNRERGQNVIEAPVDFDSIKKCVKDQLSHGRYPSDSRFGQGDSGQKIAEILAKVNPPLQKSFHENDFTSNL